MIREEVYKTDKASITQCDTSESFILTYEHETIEFQLCDLYAFRNKVLKMDMVELLDADSPELEIIHLPHCDRFLLLTVHEILEFRELLNGTFNILSLNSAIQKILRKHIFNF